MLSPSQFIAYRIPGFERYPPLVPAPAERGWMDTGTRGWANRCLPLRIANQSGWVILNMADFKVVWNGSQALDGIKILTSEATPPVFVYSMFGYGIVTFQIPYLFRTPPGFNLMARGPANLGKDGASPLEGITETDWLPYTFTMNWQITRPRTPVRFARGEPICMITPIRRGDVEELEPEVRDLESEPDLLRSYHAWHESRKAIRDATRDRDTRESHNPTQGHYIRGEGHLGERSREHQTKLFVKPFEGGETASVVVAAPPPAAPGFWRRLFGRGLA